VSASFAHRFTNMPGYNAWYVNGGIGSGFTGVSRVGGRIGLGVEF